MKKITELLRPTADDSLTHLCCAGCGSEYVHQRRVDVFERTEDAARGLHVQVIGQSLAADSSMEGNPSSRRQAASLAFDCEECGGITIITFVQHKGLTQVSVDVL